MWQRAKVAPPSRGYDPSRVVHLRNLPEDIDMDDVMELGRPFGPVISALRIKETQVYSIWVSYFEGPQLKKSTIKKVHYSH